MKKSVLSIALAAVLAVSVLAFTACDDAVRIYAPDGAPVLALADMWGEDISVEGNTRATEYTVTGESNVSTLMTNGDADFIVAPLNVGANIHAGYEAGKMNYDYKLLNVTSWGVVYFTTNSDEHKSRSEFAEGRDGAIEFLGQFDGDTLSTIGLAAIPGKSAQYLFSQAGADVTLNGADATVIQQSYIKGEDMTAVFAQPAITGTQTQAAQQGHSLTVLGSVSEIYEEITGHAFPMAGMFVRADVLEDDPELVEAVNARVKSSVEKFASDTQTVAEKAEGIEGFSLKAAVIVKAKDTLNVAYKNAADSKSDVEALLANTGSSCDDKLFV